VFSALLLGNTQAALSGRKLDRDEVGASMRLY
jgi:hypothetical protein